MLRKLLKHEFRATARIMGPLYLVLLATALGMRFSFQVLTRADSRMLNALGGLLSAAYVVAILGVCFAAFGLMIQRFYRSLLTDEGYLMFTLPVSVHQHVWSKLIVSSVWFIATGAAVMVSMLVMSVDGTFLPGLIRETGKLFEFMTAYYALNGTAIVLEFALLIFASCVAFALQFYAAMAVGYSRPTHKMAWSVAFFFLFQFAIQFVGTFLLLALDESPLHHLLMNVDIHITPMIGIHIGMGLLIGCVVLYGAVFYVVTTYFLKHHLNLE